MTRIFQSSVTMKEMKTKLNPWPSNGSQALLPFCLLQDWGSQATTSYGSPLSLNLPPANKRSVTISGPSLPTQSCHTLVQETEISLFYLCPELKCCGGPWAWAWAPPLTFVSSVAGFRQDVLKGMVPEESCSVLSISNSMSAFWTLNFCQAMLPLASRGFSNLCMIIWRLLFCHVQQQLEQGRVLPNRNQPQTGTAAKRSEEYQCLHRIQANPRTGSWFLPAATYPEHQIFADWAFSNILHFWLVCPRVTSKIRLLKVQLGSPFFQIIIWQCPQLNCQPSWERWLGKPKMGTLAREMQYSLTFC